MQELWFLCMTHRLNVLYKCMKLRCNTTNGYQVEIPLTVIKLNTANGYQVIEQTPNSIANGQREKTPKKSKAELWFLCMIHCLIVL